MHEKKRWGKELKPLREVYEETRLRKGCYLSVSDKKKQKTRKESNSIKGTLMQI